MAGGANRTVARTPQSAAWTLRIKEREGQAPPLRFLQLYKFNARSAIDFRFLLVQKEVGVWGQSPRYSVRSTVTPHGVRQKEKKR